MLIWTIVATYLGFSILWVFLAAKYSRVKNCILKLVNMHQVVPDMHRLRKWDDIKFKCHLSFHCQNIYWNTLNFYLVLWTVKCGGLEKSIYKHSKLRGHVSELNTLLMNHVNLFLDSLLLCIFCFFNLSIPELCKDYQKMHCGPFLKGQSNYQLD